MAEQVKSTPAAGKVPSPAAAPERASQKQYDVRETTKGEVVRTPYGSVLVGVNSVVVKWGAHEVALPKGMWEAIVGAA